MDETPIARWDRGIPQGADHVHGVGDCRFISYGWTVEAEPIVTVKCVWCRAPIVQTALDDSIEAVLTRIIDGGV